MSIRRVKLTGLLVLALLTRGSSLVQQAAPSAAATLSASSGSMLIVQNAGQWPAAARFQVWGFPLGAGTTWLADDAIWVVVASGKLHEVPERSVVEVASSEAPAHPRAYLQPVNLQPATLHALKLTFPGSNPDVRIEPFNPLTTTISYFIGDDPEQWHPAVPVWGGVRYADLYPGVDLVLGGRDGDWRLENAPGAVVEQVRVQVDGADIVGVNGVTLQLVVDGESQSIDLPSALFAYEVSGSSYQDGPQDVAMHSDRSSAQWTHPVDVPTDLVFSTFLGGSEYDFGRGIAMDGAGSAYATGHTGSSSFPTTPGAFDPSLNGYDAFIVKLNPTGSGLIYATFLGGNDGDLGQAIALDGARNVYVTGETYSDDFPTTPGAFDQSYNGYGSSCLPYPPPQPCPDVFVAKLNPTGNILTYATYLGGIIEDYSESIAVDHAGSAYVTGWTAASDFPTTPGAFDPSFNGCCGSRDAFVVKLNPSGSSLAYASFLGGLNEDYGEGIAVDQAGSAFVTGETFSSDFPVTPGAFDPRLNLSDAFVVRLSPTGSRLVYGTFLGGNGGERAIGIAVDGTGSAYVTGNTSSSDFPTTSGAFDPCFNGGGSDAYVAKFNAFGSELVYASFLGGTSAPECGFAIALDGLDAYVTGETASSDFPTTPGSFDPGYNGHGDVFVAKLNLAGSELVYATFLGGSGVTASGPREAGYAIAADGAGYAYVIGRTDSSDFPTTPGAFDQRYNGDGDVFVAKLNTMPYAPNVLAPVEQPNAGAFVTGTVTLSGYAIDLASPTGTGIDLVHIYLDGPYGTGIIIGGATYGLDRPNIAAQYGARFGPSGWELAWDASGVAPGVHQLYLYAHRTTDNAWSMMDPHLVIVPGGPTTWLPIMLRSR